MPDRPFGILVLNQISRSGLDRLPAGRYTVRAVVDSQELDSRTSTGTVYWEGLSELLDGTGRRVGLGYLEMTGYAGKLSL